MDLKPKTQTEQRLCERSGVHGLRFELDVLKVSFSNFHFLWALKVSPSPELT